MPFDPHAWDWPQWTLAIMMFLGLAIDASLHGKPRVNGDDEPEKRNFFIALCRFLLWGFVLVAGGFFGGN